MAEMTMKEALKVLRTGTETELQKLDMPWARSEKDLSAIVEALSTRSHDYGTCVYAMSIAAEAAFNLMAHKLGVTGFQASCADLDIVRRTRHLKAGYALLDYENLLYPQYREKFDKFAFETLLSNPELKEWLRKEAAAKIAENANAHPEVLAHWQRLAA